jgi:acyl carrier protein
MSTAHRPEPANGSQTTSPDDHGDFDAFVTRLGHEVDVSFEGAWPEARLVDDLGLDSITLFRLVVLLEDVAPHELPLELVDNLQTLADVWHWYTNLAEQQTSAATGASISTAHGDER